tara:strand:- start:171 stop:386 length:216 start_codon:yes stop_codon:yes gene_type:complete
LVCEAEEIIIINLKRMNMNSIRIKPGDILLGFSIGFVTYKKTNDLVYALIAGICFTLLISFGRTKRKQSKK